MTSDRIKEIQAETAYPDSVSVMLALKQVWNECEQKQVKKMNRSELNKKANDYISNSEYGRGINITLHGLKYMMVDFYLDQVKNLAIHDVAKPKGKLDMFQNMQYYMEHCQREGYITPQDWLKKEKHF
jgi:hypothetical protein